MFETAKEAAELKVGVDPQVVDVHGAVVVALAADDVGVAGVVADRDQWLACRPVNHLAFT